MISLVGGELYQWDTGRIVRVVPDENVKVHEVHFSTKRMDYAYVLKTYTVDGVTYCAIPNIILQQSNRLLCYEVCENSDGEETIANTYFDIIKRNRPEDYVYTEQDHFTIQALSNRVDKLEESSHTHINKTELDTITKEDLETWRSPNSSAITGGAQVGTLFEDLEVTTTLAEDASEWTSASSQPFKCTFRPSPGQMVVVKVKDLDVDTITIAKIPPTGYPLGQTIIGNYSVVNSRLKSWYNDADSVPPTPNDAQANSCLVFEDQYYDSEHLTPSLPICILYTKTPGTYKVTVTTLKHSIGPESVVKMYDVRPSTFAEYGTYTNWKDLTKSGKYDLWEVSIKKTNYYNGVYLKEVNGTKYIYVYRSEQKKDPESGIFTTTDYTLTYDTATETVTCSDATINPETDVIISVHLDQVISTVPDNATSLGKPSADKVGKMLTTVDLGEGVIDNKWQSRRYEYQWVDAPHADWSVNDETDPSYVKNRIGHYAEKEAAKNNTTITIAPNVLPAEMHYMTLSDDDTIFADMMNGIANETCSAYLYYKEKRYAPSWSISTGGAYTTGWIQVKDKLAINVELNDSSYSKGVKVYFLNTSSIDCVILPDEVYLTITYPVEIPSDLLPLADPTKIKSSGRGTVSVSRYFNLNDQSSMSDDDKKWYSSYDTAIDTDGLLCIRRNIAGGNKDVLNEDALSGSLVSNDGQTMIFGSADDTVEILGLTESNFPVVVTRINIIYDSMPTWTYMISTADGKKGHFTYKHSGVLSPITWTFEGGGQDYSEYVNGTKYTDYDAGVPTSNMTQTSDYKYNVEHDEIPMILGQKAYVYYTSTSGKTYSFLNFDQVVKRDPQGNLYVGSLANDPPFCIYSTHSLYKNDCQFVNESAVKLRLFEPNPNSIDPRYIPDMYYEDKVQEYPANYEMWCNIVGGANSSRYGKTLTIKYDGVIYPDITPTFSDGAWFYKLTDSAQVIVRSVVTVYPEKECSFLVGNPTVHKIPSKYISASEPFIITPTYNDDTKTWSTDRTWDEVKAAAAKSTNPNDYAISWDNYSLLPPNELDVRKNSSGEITRVIMDWVVMRPQVVPESEVHEGFGDFIPGSDYGVINYIASASSIEFGSAMVQSAFPIIKSVKVISADDGTLVCDPTNTVDLYSRMFGMSVPQFICPLFYNGETYHFETGKKDSSNILSLYFSTVSNSIYKRLKITQGQNGATDTVVMDKEIELNTKSFLVDFVSGPSHWTSNKTAKEIYDAANQGLRVVNNVYGLILINWHYDEVKDKYNLVFSTSGYTADNLIVAKLSATFVDSSFKGDWEFQSFDCDGIFNVLNDSDIKTGSILSVQAWNDHKPISWKAVDVLTTTNTTAFTPTADYHPATKKFVEDSIKAIPVDGITIKLNEQGQLTLALSNANGVSF